MLEALRHGNHVRAWVFATAAALLAAGPARAGETACWFEEGTLVVPAEVAGAAGDYILDTGTARTLLHETRAQAEGFAGTALTGDVRLAGLLVKDRPVAVEAIDARTYAHPTPIAGVIGADVLSGFVLDVSYAPCRVALHPPGKAPAIREGLSLPMGRSGDLPLAAASASDGQTGVRGPNLTNSIPAGSGRPTSTPWGSPARPTPIFAPACFGGRRRPAPWGRSARRCCRAGGCGSTFRAAA